MIAVDTNVVLRLILADDPAQIDGIVVLMTEATLFIPATVMIEVEWVLRSRYRYTRAETASVLSELLRVVGVSVERPAEVNWAIERHRVGADFADMMHLVAAGRVDAFATFDRALGRAAEGSPVPVQTLG